ncbi:MAG: topoisomerase DNA-binding C4 zinc finger domain-containing protein [Opitutaceae bacterium]|nr:topoisomerase DNA-binding C4 zinc finger domain-containing protein [Opitutaceae bacterium]
MPRSNPSPAEMLVILPLVRSVQAPPKPVAGAETESSLADSDISPSPDEVLCPNCGAGMVKRTARRGSNVGHSFWGCSKYPTCRGVRNS